VYLFDPTPLQILLALVLALSAGFLAAWSVTGAGGSDGTEETTRRTAREEEPRELEPRQKVILWTAAGAALLFLLWWATLSTGSGRPVL